MGQKNFYSIVYLTLESTVLLQLLQIYSHRFIQVCLHKIMIKYKDKLRLKLCQAQVQLSLSSVQFKIESDLLCLRFITFVLD